MVGRAGVFAPILLGLRRLCLCGWDDWCGQSGMLVRVLVWAVVVLVRLVLCRSDVAVGPALLEGLVWLG